MQKLVLPAVVLGLLGALAACGGSNAPSGFGNDAGSSSGSSGGSSSGSSSGTSSGSSGSGSGSSSGINVGGDTDAGTASNDGCSDAAKLVYVLSEENDLYSFDPQGKVFTKIGALGCNTTMQANSMAVSRNAVAYVNYFDETGTSGAIFKVSTTDATCTSTNIALTSGFYQVGMGFSTDSATSTDETLYIAGTSELGAFGGGGAAGLASINLTTNSVVPIGQFSGSLSGQSAELTGTGDGRLFGFFTSTPAQVAQIASTSGATSNAITFPSLGTITDWAFSFWGGDFYLYTSTGSKKGSTVTHYTTATGTTDGAYMTNIGFNIVGAGVSTCAPTVPPTPK